MGSEARGGHGQPFDRWIVLGILIGFPLAQILLGGRVIEWARASQGRGWLEFFAWILALEWALFWVVLRDLRLKGLELSAVGFPSFSTRERIALVSVAFALVTFVMVVGDSTSARIVDGPWIVPRSLVEKLVMLAVAVTAGVCEETIFRGYLFHGLRRMGLGVGTAVTLSTISFVFIHGPEQPAGLLAFRAGAGFGLAGLYWWSGSLKLPILVHTGVDAQLALSW
jgi:membrane protease YdiL (CAAX protease family)